MGVEKLKMIALQFVSVTILTSRWRLYPQGICVDCPAMLQHMCSDIL